jgi:hypothetical protein
MELPPETLERLTSLTLTCDWTGDWIFKTLRHCTNLEVLELYLQNGEIVRWEREDDPYMWSIFRPESGLTLPNLHTLLVDGLPVDGHVELVALRLPSLRDISITFDSANRGACGKAWVCIPGEDDLILAKAVRGNCGTRESGVSTLHLGNIRLFGDHDILITALKSLPELKHLTLDHILEDVYEDLFWMLGQSLPSTRDSGAARAP